MLSACIPKTTRGNVSVIQDTTAMERAAPVSDLTSPFLVKHYISCFVVGFLLFVFVPSGSFFKPLHPNISIHILHTVLYTFPKMLKKRICLTINGLFS